MFEIEPGEDLQSNIHELDKAATLLGFLVHATDNHTQQNQVEKSMWLRTGQRLLKTHTTDMKS